MAIIPPETLDRIRQGVNIVELVREYVPDLKHAGKHWKARCPFHSEKTPSFVVSEDKGIFHCFGCGEGGDAFTFLKKMESLNFQEAAERLAARIGVRIQLTKSASKNLREKTELEGALRYALQYYRRCLLEESEGAAARQYLRKRGISEATEEAFQLGYAPASGKALLESALRREFSPMLLQKAGLLSMEDRTGRYRDHFRARLLFPLFDSRGQLVGFGGRVLADSQAPKYLNSPETPLFSKGRVLYGFYQASAALRTSKQVLLLEGYMDVLRCHQEGLSQAVAPLGTALTPEHAKLLKRYVEEGTLLFDPDSAGRAASLRAAEILMENGLFVKIALLPEGLDPDEYLGRYGKEAFERILGETKDLVEFQTHLALQRFPNLSNPLEKAKVAGAILPVISKEENELLRQQWIQRLAERLRMPEETLWRELRRLENRPRNSPGSPQPSLLPVPQKVAGKSLEEEIIQFYLHYPEFLQQSPRPNEADFVQPGCLKIWEKLQQLPMHSPQNLGTLWEDLDPEQAQWLSQLTLEEPKGTRPQECHLSLMMRLKQESRLRLLKTLETEIQEMGDGKRPRESSKIEAYQNLLKELKGTSSKQKVSR